MTKINHKAIYRQWRTYGHSVADAKAASRNAYIIGHTQYAGHWVPVLSTDLGDEYQDRNGCGSKG